MKIDIQPVQVFPGNATRLFISDQYQMALNTPPQFNCALYAVKKTVEKQGEGEAAVDVAKETEETLKSGITVEMTPEQWDAWHDQPDEEYIKECVLTNLGLTPA